MERERSCTRDDELP